MKHAERRGLPFIGEHAPRHWGIMKLAYIIIGLPVLAMYRVKTHGLNNVPDGPCIFAGNHTSYLDAPIIWSIMPKGPVHFVAKAELYENPILSWGLDNLGVLPVARGTADRTMIARCKTLLQAGERIAIFPEGSRGREREDFNEVGQAQNGAAFLAQHAKVPIVPVGIAGTDLIMPHGAKFPRFPQVTVSFGKPLYADDFDGGRREKLDALTQATMASIVDLRDEARRVAPTKHNEVKS